MFSKYQMAVAEILLFTQIPYVPAPLQVGGPMWVVSANGLSIKAIYITSQQSM